MLDPRVKKEGIAIVAFIVVGYALFAAFAAVLQFAIHGVWPWQ